MRQLSRNGLTILTWVFTGAGIVLTAGRYAIRLKTVKSLKADDYVHGLALVFLIGYVSTYTVMFPLNYSFESWVVGHGEQPWEQDLSKYFRLKFALWLLFWIVIILVKLPFLLFYRFLFGVSRSFMRAWWMVSAFAVLTFLIGFFPGFWACEAPQHLFVLEKCLSQRAHSVFASIPAMSCGLNVASDLSIIALPLFMLRELQIPTSRKVGLAALFLIAITDVVFDITRTIYTVNSGFVAYDKVWDILEPTIAVIISCLPTYKALLRPTKSTSYQNLSHRGPVTWNGKRRHNAEESNDIEIGTNSEQASKTILRHGSLEGSGDGVDATSVV